MGRVGSGSRLYKTETRCACDSRCTGATGPKCDCECGGANHGTNRVVEVNVSCGNAPVAVMPDNAKAMAVATEFRAALAPVEDELAALYARQRAGEWLPSHTFDRLRTLQSLRHRARKSKTHAARMKMLASFTAA